MSKNNPVKEKGMNETVYLFRSYHISDLEGQVLTFIDASIQDQVQRKAIKDLLRPMLWRWVIENNIADNYGIDSDYLYKIGGKVTVS